MIENPLFRSTPGTHRKTITKSRKQTFEIYRFINEHLIPGFHVLAFIFNLMIETEMACDSVDMNLQFYKIFLETYD